METNNLTDMSNEYIWYKNGKESMRSVDEEGKKPLMVDRGNGVTEQFSYNRHGDIYSSSTIKDGKYHSINDKPSLTTNPSDDAPSLQWHKDGKEHREGDKPAVISGEITSDEYPFVSEGNVGYRKNGKPHRDGNKPSGAFVMDGKIYMETFSKEGELHREGDKPAVIDGNVVSDTYPFIHDGELSYYQNGKLHREGDEPATTLINSGDILTQIYQVNGVYHRGGNKPSFIRRDEDGNVTYESYHRNGLIERDGDTPTTVKTDKHGNRTESYMKKGVRKAEPFRENGKPNKVIYFPSGNVMEEFWLNKHGGLEMGIFPHEVSYRDDAEHTVVIKNGFKNGELVREVLD